MTIDWNNFTPWTSLAGGILIGLAAALLLLMSGRIAGVSGIVGGLIPPRSGERSWRIAFLAGLIAAGLLVGLGTRYASGCTSGHGVCGFARRSPRSMAATAAFMAAGFVTVFILRHIL
jgi:uncharacterized membrane protein YedE/YeeE